MSDKASTRKGAPTKGAPRYQNLTAFKHNRNSKKTRKIVALPISGLCQKCTDILQWRKSYRKYKPLTLPKKCVSCDQKAIKDAYHVLCNDCATKQNCCAKCQENKYIVHVGVASPEEKLLLALREKCSAANLTERQRRSFMRKLERDGPEGVVDFVFLRNENEDFNDDDEEDFSEEEEEELESEDADFVEEVLESEEGEHAA